VNFTWNPSFCQDFQSNGMGTRVLSMSFGYGITSQVGMCANTSIMLEKVQRDFVYVVELQIENLNYYIQE
jgi:hypothetical protein